MNCLVIGCGYLGYRVATIWKRLGHQVFVTTRFQERVDYFSDSGFHPLVMDVTKPATFAALPNDVEVAVVSVGFDRRSNDDIRTVYVDGFENVLSWLPSHLKHLIYISSTGVLASSDGEWIDESAPAVPTRPGGKAHLEAEQLLNRGRFAQRSTILRLAGIYGPGRIPRLSAVLKKQWHLLPAKGHVNLIQVEDAAAIVNCVLEKQLTARIYHVADGQAATRREIYEFVAAETGSGIVDWNTTTDAMVAIRSSGDKRISNRKLLTETQYQFRFPDYQSGIRDSLRQTDLSDYH